MAAITDVTASFPAACRAFRPRKFPSCTAASWVGVYNGLRIGRFLGAAAVDIDSNILAGILEKDNKGRRLKEDQARKDKAEKKEAVSADGERGGEGQGECGEWSRQWFVELAGAEDGDCYNKDGKLHVSAQKWT